MMTPDEARAAYVRLIEQHGTVWTPQRAAPEAYEQLRAISRVISWEERERIAHQQRRQAMFYTTVDSDGHAISKDPEIKAFESRAAVEAYLRAAYREIIEDEDEPMSMAVEEGQFGDCWIKAHRAPTAEDLADWCKPFPADEIIVQNPGSHPGGKAWWITPSSPVLVAVFRRPS